MALKLFSLMFLENYDKIVWSVQSDDGVMSVK